MKTILNTTLACVSFGLLLASPAIFAKNTTVSSAAQKAAVSQEKTDANSQLDYTGDISEVISENSIQYSTDDGTGSGVLIPIRIGGDAPENPR